MCLRDCHSALGGGRRIPPPAFSLAFGFGLLALASLVFGFGLLAGVRASPFLCLKSRISGHLLNMVYIVKLSRAPAQHVSVPRRP